MPDTDAPKKLLRVTIEAAFANNSKKAVSRVCKGRVKHVGKHEVLKAELLKKWCID